jgi:hypothetical protein
MKPAGMNSTEALKKRAESLRGEAQQWEGLAEELFVTLRAVDASDLSIRARVSLEALAERLKAEGSVLEVEAAGGGCQSKAHSLDRLTRCLAHAEREARTRKGPLGKYWSDVEAGCKWGVAVLLKAMGGGL